MTDPTKTTATTGTSGLFSASASNTAPVVQEATAAPEEKKIEPEAPPAPQVDERELLMQRARLIGVEFSNNIGTETLRERIRAKMEALEEAEAPPEPEPEPEPVSVNALTGEPSNAPQRTFRQQQIDEQMKLVRLRITCMDPKKKDLQGEIFTIANEYIGTVRKFVPFGEVTDEGFHVPFCIYNMLEERRFLNIRTVKDKRSGSERPETQWAKEFALEILPPLTAAELARLANAQAAAGSIGD